MSKYARKVDGNQAEIVEALRAAGYIVHDCSRFAGGFPDLMVGSKSEVIVLLEVKMPGEQATQAEAKFHDLWEYYPVFMIDSIDEALSTMHDVDNGII